MQRFSLAFLSVFIIVLATTGFAQNPSSADRGKDTIYIQREEPGFPGPMLMLQESLHNLDGEVAFISAFGADAEVVKNAPYSATAVTETTQTLADGNRIVNKSSSFYARDGQGRVRREMSMDRMGRLPVGGPQMIFISDPSTHTEYILQPNDSTAKVIQGNEENGGPERRLRRKLDMIVKTRAGAERPPEKFGLQEKSDVKHEDLGTQEIEGVSCQGKRETITIPAGKVGNERPIEIVGESWYSPDLHTVVLRKHSDPRVGETVYRLTDIKKGEPDSALFQIPSGYKSIVKDETFTKE